METSTVQIASIRPGSAHDSGSDASPNSRPFAPKSGGSGEAVRDAASVSPGSLGADGLHGLMPCTMSSRTAGAKRGRSPSHWLLGVVDIPADEVDERRVADPVDDTGAGLDGARRDPALATPSGHRLPRDPHELGHFVRRHPSIVAHAQRWVRPSRLSRIAGTLVRQGRSCLSAWLNTAQQVVLERQ